MKGQLIASCATIAFTLQSQSVALADNNSNKYLSHDGFYTITSDVDTLARNELHRKRTEEILTKIGDVVRKVPILGEVIKVERGEEDEFIGSVHMAEQLIKPLAGSANQMTNLMSAAICTGSSLGGCVLAVLQKTAIGVGFSSEGDDIVDVMEDMGNDINDRSKYPDGKYKWKVQFVTSTSGSMTGPESIYEEQRQCVYPSWHKDAKGILEDTSDYIETVIEPEANCDRVITSQQADVYIERSKTCHSIDYNGPVGMPDWNGNIPSGAIIGRHDTTYFESIKILDDRHFAHSMGLPNSYTTTTYELCE